MNTPTILIPPEHPHWWYFWRPIAVAAGTIAFALLAALTGSATLFAIVTIGGFAIAGGWGAWKWIWWHWTTIQLDTENVTETHRTYWLAKTERVVPVNQIAAITTSAGFFLEQWAGSGDLVVTTSSTDQASIRFQDVRDPARFVRALNRATNPQPQPQVSNPNPNQGSVKVSEESDLQKEIDNDEPWWHDDQFDGHAEPLTTKPIGEGGYQPLSDAYLKPDDDDDDHDYYEDDETEVGEETKPSRSAADQLAKEWLDSDTTVQQPVTAKPAIQMWKAVSAFGVFIMFFALLAIHDMVLGIGTIIAGGAILIYGATALRNQEEGANNG